MVKRILALACMLWSSNTLASETVPIRAPEGFEVTRYACDDLAHDIYSMTIDARGRVVVAGRDYVKTLHDTNDDGQADTATLYSERPGSGAHGLLFVGDDLVCTGDNGVWRFRDSDANGVADGSPEKWAELRHSEHGANGLVQGPDGWIYVICGNDAGVSAELTQSPGSPVKEPECGAVVRCRPDGTDWEIVAHGFRNPYDLAFNRYGNLFTVDSDGERDHHLPWYSPTRLFDIGQGRHHGWLLKGWQRSWNRPARFYDNVQRLAEIGRGSPTGVEVYQHTQFPDRYRDGAYSCCWTLGRVYYFPLRRRGGTYRTTMETFLQVEGDLGFAPVDLAVGPDGDLFVAIGGRHTQGGVFRVRYRGGVEDGSQSDSDPLGEVLQAPQPLAAWSRTRWIPAAQKLGADAFEEAIRSRDRTLDEKVRAVEILTEVFYGLSPDLARAIRDQGKPELSARAAWSLGRVPYALEGARLVAEFTADRDPRVERAAWESWLTLNTSETEVANPDWRDLSDRSDRRKRWASLLVAARNPARVPPYNHDPLTDVWRYSFQTSQREGAFGMAAWLFQTTKEPAQRLEAIRLMQIAIGDVLPASDDPTIFAGYQAQGSDSTLRSAAEQHGWQLASAFPVGERQADLELARLLGMLRIYDSDLVARVAAMIDSDTGLLDDLHYLFVLANLPATRDSQASERVAAALAGLHRKMEQEDREPSRNWPDRVQEIFAALTRYDANLPRALIEHETFGRPEHSLFVLAMPEEERVPAARRLLEHLESQDDPWTSLTVNLVALLPPSEAQPTLRDVWEDPFLQDVATAALAQAPQEEDRHRFLAALESAQPDVIEVAAVALRTLQPPENGEFFVPLIKALRRSCRAEEWGGVREALVETLTVWSGESVAVSEEEDLLEQVYTPWLEWFVGHFPQQADSIDAGTMQDNGAWQARLAGLDWSTGMAERGKVLFAQKSCHRCHQGQTRLGPDLPNAVARSSPQDLFLAIVDPSRDVAPPYQTTQIITDSGRVYHGVVVYESPDGTLIQTGPDQVARIAGEQIEAFRKSTRSLMPDGLLNDLDDRSLADLYAYLKTLEQ